MKGLILLFAVFSFVHAQVSLGAAATFGALSYASITNTGPTVIAGNVGTTGTSITGFPLGTYTGSEYISDQATIALLAAQDAYTSVHLLAEATTLNADLGGMVLSPGVYKFSSSAELTGTLTLAGNGSCIDAWYFQIGSSLTTAAGSSVIMTGDSLAGNVFWDLGSSATIGTGTDFKGNILATASVSLGTGASVEGGVFALGGSVTLDSNVIEPGALCAAASTSSGPSSFPSRSSPAVASSSTPPPADIITSGYSSEMAGMLSSSSNLAPTSSASDSAGSPIGGGAESTSDDSISTPASASPSMTSAAVSGRAGTSTPGSSRASLLQSSSSNIMTSLSFAGSSSTIYSSSVYTSDMARSSAGLVSALPSMISFCRYSCVLATLPTSLHTWSSSRHHNTSISISASMNSTTSPASSAPSSTTSTIYTTLIHTITKCLESITNCLIGSVTTETLSIYTTICPVQKASLPPPGFAISTVYSNHIYTITNCPALVTNCPVGSIATEIISLYTTLCPILTASFGREFPTRGTSKSGNISSTSTEVTSGTPTHPTAQLAKSNASILQIGSISKPLIAFIALLWSL